jgi:hypothetical protein
VQQGQALCGVRGSLHLLFGDAPRPVPLERSHRRLSLRLQVCQAPRQCLLRSGRGALLRQLRRPLFPPALPVPFLLPAPLVQRLRLGQQRGLPLFHQQRGPPLPLLVGAPAGLRHQLLVLSLCGGEGGVPLPLRVDGAV